MVVFGQSGCIRAIVFVFWHSCCFGEKVVALGQKLLYSGKSSCIRASVVVFGQMWLSSDKMVVFGH